MIDDTELLRLLRSGCAVTPHQRQAAEEIKRLNDESIHNEGVMVALKVGYEQRGEEIERLREALKEIAGYNRQPMRGIARRALEGGGEDE